MSEEHTTPPTEEQVAAVPEAPKVVETSVDICVTLPGADTTDDDFLNLVLTGDSMILTDDAGEITGFSDMPENTGDTDALVKYLGPKLAFHDGRAAAMQAEKDIWQKRIDRVFGPSIRRHTACSAWLRKTYAAALEPVAKKALEHQKGTSKTIHLGLLTLSFTKVRESVKVLDKVLAWRWLFGQKQEDALTKDVLTSHIPEDLKKTLTKENSGVTGMEFEDGKDAEGKPRDNFAIK